MKNFEILVNSIQETHHSLQQNGLRSINKHLTIRNWLVGYYIVEFEQKGSDKAKYGTNLLAELSKSINIKGLSETALRLNRQFYLAYPQLSNVIPEQLISMGFGNLQIHQTASDELQLPNNQLLGIRQTASDEFNQAIRPELQTPPIKLITQLSYSHLLLLIPLSNQLKRTFYELECMKGSWSVDELKRQINSLYFERSGLSENPEKLSRIVQEKTVQLVPTDVIKSPFMFEFLGLKSKDVVYESDLEQALIDNLEEFLLELGHGFCFEAKQKRIIIGDKYYHIDLVFYHRLLKCHVLIDLKMKEVDHENIGQLKTYINYYKKNIMAEGDNPPVGLLLVTENDKELVEYAVADSDQDLFVSKYMLQLPSTTQIEEFLRKELNH